MQLQKGQIIELDIDDLAYLGRGVGRYEGMAVFVEGTMPGDKVKASFTKIKKQFAHAELVEIVEPANERIEAKCRHFDKCGGCQLQYMPYEKQLEMKRRHVVEALSRIGGLDGVEVSEIVGCKEEFFYRNKMEFSFGYDGEMEFSLGLHLPGRRYDILDIEECLLQSPISNEIVNKVRDFVVGRGWQPFKFSTGEGFLRNLMIREGRRTGERMVVLVGSDQVPDDLEEGLEEFAGVLEDLVGCVYFQKVISKRGQRKQIIDQHVSGKETLSEVMKLENGDELKFEILPQAFFQVNTFQAEILYGEVMKLIDGSEHEFVLDLFCGTGTIGLFAAKHAGRVLGVELNESAVAVAKKNAEVNGATNIEFVAEDAGKLVERLEERPDLVIVDPPRAGLTGKMIEGVAGFEANRIVYVSCNPASLARDLKEFGERGYKVKYVKPVDMFPQTFHIEVVCLLER